MIVVAQIAFDRGRRIGATQGQNSKVYLCTDQQLGANLVVKEIEKAKVANPNVYAEAQAMHASNHDHVVPVKYACESKDEIYLAMPYFKNGSLTDKIASGPLPLLKLIEYGQGILSGLTAIHIAGHLHFDLKPSNVLFADNDTPMVADFGQCMPLNPIGIAAAPRLMYGPVLTPEICNHSQGTIQTDIYQAGLTLYRAANGDQFFNDQLTAIPDLRQAVVDGAFPDRQQFMPHVPKAMRTVIRKAMMPDVTARFQTALEFAKSLGKISVTWPWSVKLLLGDEIEWRANRSGRAPLMVALRANGSRWNVQLYTESPASCRKTKTVLWRTRLTRTQAMQHLKSVFETLE